ncbi:hypothetical protein DL96DRAFT_1616445 [Flagelloscypha sp. PMI_526]|nr:hypothetical protein DL96DRAFT_1616445 [Flagelloscypha sp. PMI_526]
MSSSSSITPRSRTPEGRTLRAKIRILRLYQFTTKQIQLHLRSEPNGRSLKKYNIRVAFQLKYVGGAYEDGDENEWQFVPDSFKNTFPPLPASAVYDKGRARWLQTESGKAFVPWTTMQDQLALAHRFNRLGDAHSDDDDSSDEGTPLLYSASRLLQNSRPLKRKSHDGSPVHCSTEEFESTKKARLAYNTIPKEEKNKGGPNAHEVIDLTCDSDSERDIKPDTSHESQPECDTQVRKFLQSLVDLDLDQYPELRQIEIVKKLLFCRGIQAIPLERVLVKSIKNLKELDKFVIVAALQQFSPVKQMKGESK